MSKIVVKLAEDQPKELCEGGPVNGPKLAMIIMEDVAKFEEWMAKNLGGGLSKFERAAIQTYIYSKLVGRIDNLEIEKE